MCACITKSLSIRTGSLSAPDVNSANNNQHLVHYAIRSLSILSSNIGSWPSTLIALPLVCRLSLHPCVQFVKIDQQNLYEIGINIHYFQELVQISLVCLQRTLTHRNCTCVGPQASSASQIGGEGRMALGLARASEHDISLPLLLYVGARPI